MGQSCEDSETSRNPGMCNKRSPFAWPLSHREPRALHCQVLWVCVVPEHAGLSSVPLTG